jgi:hypothetical protein
MNLSHLPSQLKLHCEPLTPFGPQPPTEEFSFPMNSPDQKRLKLGHTAPASFPFSSSFPRPSPLSSLDESDGHVFGDEIHSCISSVDYLDDRSHAMSSASSDFSPSSSLDETDHIAHGRSGMGWY